MFFRNRVRLGVDVGRASVKVAVRDARGQLLELLETPTVEAPQSFDQEPEPAETAARLRRLVGKYLEGGRYSLTTAAAVQGDGALGGYLELPPLEERQRQLAVESAAARQLPFAGSEALLNYMPVPPRDGKSSWFFLAVRRAAADPVKDMLEKAGLAPDSLDVHALALLRRHAALHPEGDECGALVHVGARLTCAVLVQGPHPYAIRCFRVGGDDFTYALQMGMQCSWAEAEAHKRASDATAREVAVETAVGKWLEQVDRSLRGFVSRLPGFAVARVRLSGGGAAWKGLDRRVAETLGVPAEVEADPGFAVALGLGGERT